MIKRTIDIVVSAMALIVLSPIILLTAIAVWLQDRHSPLYIAWRVGFNGREFGMIKLRSMVVNNDRVGSHISGNDPRITAFGRVMRRCKLDEFTQFWNVLKGEMSLVGPRPGLKRETDVFTQTERKLLSIRPGISDFASIVFADQGEILKTSDDPNRDYTQLIRPWKSRLGLFYLEHASIMLDLKVLTLTAVALINRKQALRGVRAILLNDNADEELIRIASRQDPLVPALPPGA
ncbi:sugar transferase [bacterium]|nr:sugar transferase [bacterium]